MAENNPTELSLSAILADELLPAWLVEFEQIIVLHMLELIKHTPKGYEAEFESETQWLNQFIESRFKASSPASSTMQPSPSLQTLNQAYKKVTKQRQLDTHPLPGFICCEINTIGSQRVVFLQQQFSLQ
ncbi:MAG: hypothetical protein ACI8WB_005257 [Phenylobacterium sp.]|jgi:hypothetical protein